MENNRSSRRQFIKGCLTSASAFVVAGLAGCKKEDTKVRGNPYKYDIEKFKKIDESLMLYEERAPVSVNVKQLKGLAVSSDDILFVTGNKTVSCYTPDGKLLKSFKIKEEAHCIAAGKKDEIYIGMKDHVEVYALNGSRLGVWSGLGETAHITSLAVKDDLAVIADYGNKQLWLFSKEGNLVRFIKTLNKSNHREDFRIPSPYFDVNFDTEGNIWAVNPGRHRLEEYSPDGTQKSSWGKASMEIDGFTGCCNPTHFTVTADGDIITAEKGIVRVKLYTRDGLLKGVVAGPASFREGTTGLSLATDSKGNVYVADPARKQARVFRLKK